jgi:hypothetical protein
VSQYLDNQDKTDLLVQRFKQIHETIRKDANRTAARVIDSMLTEQTT